MAIESTSNLYISYKYVSRWSSESLLNSFAALFDFAANFGQSTFQTRATMSSSTMPPMPTTTTFTQPEYLICKEYRSHAVCFLPGARSRFANVHRQRRQSVYNFARSAGGRIRVASRRIRRNIMMSLVQFQSTVLRRYYTKHHCQQHQDFTTTR